MAIAFVAGATGYTGREVVRALVARGVTTTAHVRPDSQDLLRLRHELESEGAEVDVTPWDDSALKGTLARSKPTIVFALLGTTRARARAARHRASSAESYESIDYGLTAKLLRASIASGSHPTFVYLSALGAGRPSKNPYYAARFKAEAEVRQSGLPYLIARPSFITGPDRIEPRTGERVAAAVVDGALGWAARLGVRSLHDRYGSMSARTLAYALVALGLEGGDPARVVETGELRARTP